MSNTVTSTIQSKQQFQGLFNEMWAVTATIDFASVAAGAESTESLTIPGVALGDMVIGVASSVSLTATGEASIDAYVSAANTVMVRLSNVHASSAVDLASSTWKLLIGRPAW